MREIAMADMKSDYSCIFFLTWDCNLRCKYCYEGGVRKTDSMSQKVAFDGIDFFMKMAKRLHIQFFGGEPLMKFGLMKEMEEYLKKNYPNRYSFSIYTNGTFINDEVLDWFKKNKVHVTLSIDGPKEVNDINRVYPDGSSSFDKIKHVLDGLDRNSSRIRMTVTPNNVENMFESMKFFYDLGFSDIQEEVDRFAKWSEDKIDILVNEYKRLGDFLVNVYTNDPSVHWRNYERRVFPFASPQNKRRSRCGTTERSCSLDVNGNLYPCQKFIVNQQMCIGDIYTGFNETQIEIVKNFRLPNYLAQTRGCKECEYVGTCFAGCIADNMIKDTNQIQDCLFRRVHYQFITGVYNRLKDLIDVRRAIAPAIAAATAATPAVAIPAKYNLSVGCGGEGGDPWSCGSESSCGGESGTCGGEASLSVRNESCGGESPWSCGGEGNCGGENEACGGEGHGLKAARKDQAREREDAPGTYRSEDCGGEGGCGGEGTGPGGCGGENCGGEGCGGEGYGCGGEGCGGEASSGNIKRDKEGYSQKIEGCGGEESEPPSCGGESCGGEGTCGSEGCGGESGGCGGESPCGGESCGGEY